MSLSVLLSTSFALADDEVSFLVRFKILQTGHPFSEVVAVYLGEGRFLVPQGFIHHFRQRNVQVFIQSYQDDTPILVLGEQQMRAVDPKRISSNGTGWSDYQNPDYAIVEVERSLANLNFGQLQAATFALYDSEQLPVQEHSLQRSNAVVINHYPRVIGNELEVPARSNLFSEGGVLTTTIGGRASIVALNVSHESTSFPVKRRFKILTRELVHGFSSRPPPLCRGILLSSMIY